MDSRSRLETTAACAPFAQPIPQARCKVPFATGGEKPKAILCASSEEACGRVIRTKKPYPHELDGLDPMTDVNRSRVLLDVRLGNKTRMIR